MTARHLSPVFLCEYCNLNSTLLSTDPTRIVQLGPIPKLKLEGKSFGPKQNTRFTYYQPPTHPSTLKRFYLFQDTYPVEK